MAKVIVERPRLGSRLPSKRKGYDRRTARLAWEDQPKREGMKVRSGAGKSLNEHLAPLRRYLERQVGQPWDKIFADICRHVDRNNPVQDHVRDHLDDYVATCVIIHRGELYHASGYGVGRPLNSLFYVCPRTGILKRNPRPRHWFFAPPKKLRVHILDDGSALVRKDGVWHIIEWRTLPSFVWVRGCRHPISAPQLESVWDALLQIRVYRDQAERIYGHPIHALTARRATKREVRHVVNSYPYTNVVR